MLRVMAIYTSTMAYLGDRIELACDRLKSHDPSGYHSETTADTKGFTSLKESLSVSVSYRSYQQTFLGLPATFNRFVPCAKFSCGKKPYLHVSSLAKGTLYLMLGTQKWVIVTLLHGHLL